MIRVATFILLTAALLTACRTRAYREETSTTTVYEGRPVEVLPPQGGTPPQNVARPRERATTTPPPLERQTETETQPPTTATPRATPRVTVNTGNAAPQFPVAKAVPGKPGFVYSPFESNGTMIDVTGYSSGTKVKDPGTNKIFIVP